MLTKENRAIVLEKCNGRCAYCGICLDGIKWHADHFHPVMRKPPYSEHTKPENDNIDNLMPSCPSCNISKSCNSLEGFREMIGDRLNQLSMDAKYKTALRYGLIKEQPKEIVFYFENPSVMVDAFEDGTEEILKTLEEYLEYKSVDGTPKKNELRQKLKELLEAKDVK